MAQVKIPPGGRQGLALSHAVNIMAVDGRATRGAIVLKLTEAEVN